MISANFIENSLTRIKNIYGLDTRALSLMRVLVGLVLLFDLCIRASSLTAHYTSSGAVPFNEIENFYWQKGYFSLFQFCDAYWFAALVYAISGCCYLGLLLGYKTRLFTFLSWLMLVSIQNRNPLILQSGDDFLRLIAFWGIFLPWGNFYSLDARNTIITENSKKYFSVASLGYVFLLFSVYFFSGILKTSAEWDCREGTALFYSFNIDQMVWPLGKMLLSYPTLLKCLSVSVIWLELLAPFLLFIPFKNPLFRMLFIVLIASLQISISITLFVGLFYLISIISLVGLLSSRTMDKFDSLVKFKRTYYKNTRLSFLHGLRENYYFKVILNCFLFFFMALSLLWNISVTGGSGVTVSDNFFPVGYALRLNQGWGMFAPTVLKDDGWYILEGITPTKIKIDVNREGANVDFTKPQSVLTYIKDDRWRKFGENYMLEQNAFIRPHYCSYLIQDWNKKHPDNKIDSLTVIYMKETTLPPGKLPIATKEKLCKCKN